MDKSEDFGSARAVYTPGSWLSPKDFDRSSERPTHCVCGERVEVVKGAYNCPSCDGEEDTDTDEVEDALDLLDSLLD